MQIECHIFRGGTTKGLFILEDRLPAERNERNKTVAALLGSGTNQVDGLGGGSPLVSKAVLLKKSDHPDADIDYRCIQVLPGRGLDDSVPCGNLLAAAGQCAIENGLFKAGDPMTTVRIRDINTSALVDSSFQSPGGTVDYSGTEVIMDIQPSAPVEISYRQFVGARTGKLWPAGDVVTEIDGMRVTLIDAAVPLLIIPAKYFGVNSSFRERELSRNRALISRLLLLRQKVADRAGMGDVSGTVLPKVALILPPDNGGSLGTRYFTPNTLHPSLAVSGAIALTAAALTPGTVAHEHASISRPRSGKTKFTLETIPGNTVLTMQTGADGRFESAQIMRTARLLAKLTAYVNPGFTIPPDFHLT